MHQPGLQPVQILPANPVLFRQAAGFDPADQRFFGNKESGVERDDSEKEQCVERNPGKE